METSTTGLSLDFILHPGISIKEKLEENNMNQEELAERTGFSAKHVSEVINGKKGISPKFAKALEYVFGVKFTFWLKLQAIYDKEIIAYQERNNIDKREIEITKRIEPILEYAILLNLINKYNNTTEEVIIARNLCKTNNLLNIEKLLITKVAYRTAKNIQVDEYVLYAWQRVCELIAEKETIEDTYHSEKLKNYLQDIKQLMFEEDPNMMIQKLKEIFKKCGIIFELVKNFQGAPIQGFIENKNDRIILCMTIRQSYADIFWFTLFHEIGHILNDDIKENKLDYYIENTKTEEIADNFAKDFLISSDKYEEYVQKKDFSIESIKEFSQQNKIKEFVLIGRLQKDNLLPYNKYSNLKTRYKWKK